MSDAKTAFAAHRDEVLRYLTRVVGCGALAMGLQIEAVPPDRDTLAPGITGQVSAASGRELRARVTGTLRVTPLLDDRMGAELTVREVLLEGGQARGSSSSTRRITTQVGEVTALELPTPGRPRDAGPDPAGALSLRLRLRRIW